MEHLTSLLGPILAIEIGLAIVASVIFDAWGRDRGAHKTGVHDSLVTNRNRRGRWVHTFMVTGGALLCPAWIGYWYLTNMEGSELFGALAGLFVGAFIAGMTISFTVAFVPSVQGLTTRDEITGNLVSYGQGAHAKYLWETVHTEDHQNLEIRTDKVSAETMATLTAEILLSFMFQWRPSIEHLEVFRGVEDSTINEGFENSLRSLFSELVAYMDPQDARKGVSYLTKVARAAFAIGEPVTRKHLNDKERELENHYGLLKKFRGIRAHENQSFRERYGVELILITVTDIDFSARYQRSRDAIAQGQALLEIVANMHGLDLTDPDDMATARKMAQRPEYKQALEYALVMSEPDAKLDVHSVHLSGLDPEVVQDLASAAGKWARNNNKKGSK